MSGTSGSYLAALTDLPLEPGETPRCYQLDEEKAFLGIFGGHRYEHAVSNLRWITRESGSAPVVVRIEDIEAIDGSIGGGFFIPDIPGDAAILLIPLCMIVLAPFVLLGWVYDRLTRGQLARTDWAYWDKVKKAKVKVRGAFFRTPIRGRYAKEVGYALALAVAERGR